MAYTNETKNTGTYTDGTINNGTLVTYLRHGKEPTMEELENRTLNEVSFIEGGSLEDVTFEELEDKAYTNNTKNT